MTPTERDKNRYAIMEEAREAYGRLLGDETGAPYAHLALTFGINRIAHDIRLHLNDEDLSAEEARALAILAIAEKSLLPTRALLDAVTFYLDLGSNDRKIQPRIAHQHVCKDLLCILGRDNIFLSQHDITRRCQLAGRMDFTGCLVDDKNLFKIMVYKHFRLLGIPGRSGS